MKSFHLTVSTPDGNLFDGECLKLSVRGEEGSLAVMAGHIPFVSAVVSGECSILLPDDSELFGTVDGGVLAVDLTNTTLIAGSFAFSEESDE